VGESGTDVRGHIVRALRRVAVVFVVFGNEPLKEITQIQCHVGIGVLLDHEGA